MSKKILIINWRGLRDEKSGGAEFTTFNYSKRWVTRHNSEVIWLSPPPRKGISFENIDGVEFKYLGIPFKANWYYLILSFPLFYFLVFCSYIIKYGRWADIVIDQSHGIPYLTSIYSKKKVVLFIHEVAGKIWREMYPRPISSVGVFLEKTMIPTYKKFDCITVSESTKSEIVKLGLDENNIRIIPSGIIVSKFPVEFIKESDLTLVYLNRVVKMKRTDLSIDVFAKINSLNPQSKLWIIGRGDEGYIDFLKNKCFELGVEKKVVFWGYIESSKKEELLSKAHVLINTSVKEGWGLVNIEANSQGTPAVAFDVPGNNESIIDGVTGFLVPEGDTDRMVQKILELKTPNKKLYSDCVEHSKKYDWDSLSDQFYEIFEK